MRSAKIPIFVEPSVRLAGGTNIGIFRMSVITSRIPLTEPLHTLLIKYDVATSQALSSPGTMDSFSCAAFDVKASFGL